MSMTLKSLKSFFSNAFSHTRTHTPLNKKNLTLHTCKPRICKGPCALTVCQSQSETVNKAKPVKRKPLMWRPWFMPGGGVYTGSKF